MLVHSMYIHDNSSTFPKKLDSTQRAKIQKYTRINIFVQF